MRVGDIEQRLRSLASREKAEVLQSFFKTGPGQYGEGDIFFGIPVPQLRKLAREYANTTLTDSIKLLKSPVHEQRLLALLLLIQSFSGGDDHQKEEIFKLYLKHRSYVNNWDLVDLSAPHIVGKYLYDKPRDVLYRMAISRSLWERRISVISTLYFIRQNRFSDTFSLSRILLQDEHDLIQKAVGWMLREVGKRNVEAEKEFIDAHYRKMPRTMLRYAIERFPKTTRMRYLKGLV
jgi:3-methyladenine DNA glycosylase AlkD